MNIVDENGNFQLEPGTLKPVESDHPVFKARIALGLPRGAWLYAPQAGHDLAQYDLARASDTQKLAFQKAAELYLQPYGPEVISRLTDRGTLVLSELVTKDSV